MPPEQATLAEQFVQALGTNDRELLHAIYHRDVIVIHFRNTGPFYGNPPTGERGTMSETHAVRLRDGKIVEQFVGDSNFAMPYHELVAWENGLPPRHPRSQPGDRRSECTRRAFAKLAVTAVYP